MSYFIKSLSTFLTTQSMHFVTKLRHIYISSIVLDIRFTMTVRRPSFNLKMFSGFFNNTTSLRAGVFLSLYRFDNFGINYDFYAKIPRGDLELFFGPFYFSLFALLSRSTIYVDISLNGSTRFSDGALFCTRFFFLGR